MTKLRTLILFLVVFGFGLGVTAPVSADTPSQSNTPVVTPNSECCPVPLCPPDC